jgi:dTDP-4-dehydrorhamnose reductase
LRTLDEIGPDAVNNAAAYNFVDRAEQQPEACRAINADAVRYIAEACRRLNCTLVQVSTAYVFDGLDRLVPYCEHDAPRPATEYGRTKLAGECWAADHARHFIVRTGPMFGPCPPRAKTTNFIDLMLRLGQSQSVVRVVDDQHVAPSHLNDVARAIIFLLAADSSGSAPYGVYHIAGRSAVTWHDLAAEVFRQAQLQATLEAVSTAQFGALASRPRYAVLDTTRYQALGGPALRGWQPALADYLAQLNESWRWPTKVAT